MLEMLMNDIPFADQLSAESALQRIGLHYPGLEVIFPTLLSTLRSAADPDRSLVNFERFVENYGEGLPAVLDQNPRVIEILVTLFSTSQFLTEILLNNPRSIALLLDRQQLSQRKTIEQILSEAEGVIRRAHGEAQKKDALRLYHRSELLRIGASDFLDLYNLQAVISQISRTAIALTRACLNLAVRQTGISADDFCVLAMGKLGGRELNYSSDIDLLFITRNDSQKTVPLAQKLIDLLASTTSQGFLYRVDMRLRPWGNDGPLVTTLQGFLKYLNTSAHLWEKQALLKVRPIAGNLALGEELREQANPIIFSLPPEEVRTAVFSMKKRTEEFLREKGRYWGEVKLGVGSIRDIEFVVQYLQLAYVSLYPQIRTRATLKALPRLQSAGLLSAVDTRVLTDGYIFLRTIEHFLQMMDYRQTYTLPSDRHAITLLARRLGFSNGETFVARYQEHCQAIRSIYMRIIGSEPLHVEHSPSARQHASRMHTSYSRVFTPDEIQQHSILSQKLNENVLAVLDVDVVDERSWRVTIVGYDYPGELSIICGLLFVYGFDIVDGLAFTYEPQNAPAQNQDSASGNSANANIRQITLNQKKTAQTKKPAGDSRRKIVDVFTVRSVTPQPPVNIWDTYITDLSNLLSMFHSGERRKARGQLAKRVGAAYNDISGSPTPLLPIDIDIDNEVSQRYTVLRIDAPDTLGFLYEFTNALAFTRINIARMIVRTVGKRAQDILYVNDASGRKIIDEEKQRELRATVVLIKNFTHLLPSAPNPETALLHFHEFLMQLLQHPNWPDEFTSLEHSDVLTTLAHIFGVSEFLWDDFLRMQHANLFPVVRDVDALSAAKPRTELDAEITRSFASGSVAGIAYPDWREVLNAFKDRELFRIDMRHILGLTSEFWDFAGELSDLAETVISAALLRCRAELDDRYGAPFLDDGSPCGISIVALGKCGGRELGFASDIELMFVYRGKGETRGPEKIGSDIYYEKLVHSLVTTIHARQEGIFQIDLQIRPYGKAGSMAVSLESFRRYYVPEGPAWAYERQALVKLRPIAGDIELGEELCRLRDDYTYCGGPFDVTAMRAMRERQIRHLVTGGTFNAKYSPGGLVDVEYLIQALQINHGAAIPELRVTNIRRAMALLNEAGILNYEDYTSLRKAHTFLRWLIDSLRVVRGNAKDITVPPYESEEFAFLARRLRYGNDINSLNQDLNRYQTEVQEINHRLLD